MKTADTVSSRLGPERQRFTPANLAQENQTFAGTGGVSRGNQHRGFRPAFLESSSGKIYLSRFADGRPAPVHVLDGLPPALVAERTPTGRVSATLRSVISGFVRGGDFYTREQTAKLMAV
jgi:hypothetical protein